MKQSTTLSQSGFTLIELMITVAIVAILAALVAPALQEFAIKNRLKNIGFEFTSSVLKARNTAINGNTCVTLCISTNTDENLPSCSTTGSDWQVGWIGFLNPSCDSPSQYSPSSIEEIFIIRNGESSDYHLNVQGTAIRRIRFNARGLPNARREFDLVYQSVGNSITENYGFNICLDVMGRTKTISNAASCP